MSLKKKRERERSSNLLILHLSLVKISIGVNKKLPKDKKENSGIFFPVFTVEGSKRTAKKLSLLVLTSCR